MRYNKLVRDKIPKIIKANGEVPIIHYASDEEYGKKLKEKLLEEVNEFLKEEDKEELADVLEVIENICKFKGINNKELESVKKRKKEEKGEF